MHHPSAIRWILVSSAAIFAAKEGAILTHHEAPQPPLPMGSQPIASDEPAASGERDAVARQSIHMDAETQRLSGLIISPPQPSIHQRELQLYGIVAEAQGSTATIRLAVPESADLHPVPQLVLAEDAAGQPVSARLIRQEERVDAANGRVRIALYQVDAPAAWPADARVRLRVPVSAPTLGVMVPESAVVWRDGLAWVYVARAADPSQPAEEFTRQQIPVDALVAGGWFVAARLTATDRIVTQGAQLLLSTEYQSEIPQGE